MPVWKDASDAAAFVQRYSGMILRRCFTDSLGRADAQDICQNVVYLYYYEGYNAEEIAAMVGAKPAAVRQRLARAREKPRKELEGSGYETI